MSELEEWLRTPGISDLGENAFILLELVKTMKDSRFLDLGVRGGVSSAILSYNTKERNNSVYGCDINFDLFFERGRKFVDDEYTGYLYDSVTLGKNWDEDPFDIIFVDTEHSRIQVLCELYFWIDHLKEGGYFVFHDSHWEQENSDLILYGKNIGTVDLAINDFFNLPKSIKEFDVYEDKNIQIRHYPSSYGLTFIKVNNIDFIKNNKKNINWEEVFETRNWICDLVFNEKNPKCISKDWGIDYNKVIYEPLIKV